MIGRPAFQAGAPSRHSPDDVFVRHIYVNGIIKLFAQLIQSLVKHLRLRDCSGETVQHIASCTVLLGHTVQKDLHGKLIRHQKALIHVLLGLHPQLRPFAHIRPENIPRGHMGNTVLLRDHLRLRSLSGARRTQHDYLHPYTSLYASAHMPTTKESIDAPQPQTLFLLYIVSGGFAIHKIHIIPKNTGSNEITGTPWVSPQCTSFLHHTHMAYFSKKPL